MISFPLQMILPLREGGRVGRRGSNAAVIRVTCPLISSANSEWCHQVIIVATMPVRYPTRAFSKESSSPHPPSGASFASQFPSSPAPLPSSAAHPRR